MQDLKPIHVLKSGELSVQNFRVNIAVFEISCQLLISDLEVPLDLLEFVSGA